MKKFKFRLEKLLEARLAKEKGVKIELAHAISEQNVFRTKQSNYISRMEDQKKLFHDKMKSGKINISELKNYHFFEVTVDLVIADTRNKIDAMEPAINVIRNKLNEAVKERRVIEKLKERRHDEWQYLANRAEYNEVDDMNQKLYMRKIVEEMKEARRD
jgi:flagellar FliJ protein